MALLGEVTSARSKAGGIVANRKRVPMITPSATNPEVTKVGPFVFRVCFTDDVQAVATAAFLVDKGKKRVGMLFATDDLYSSGLAEGVRQESLGSAAARSSPRRASSRRRPTSPRT